jgi:hypothetical protein
MRIIILLLFANLLYSCSKERVEPVRQNGIHILDYHYIEYTAQSVPCSDDRWYTFVGKFNNVADFTIDFIVDTLQSNREYTIYMNKWTSTGWTSDSATITNVQYSNSVLNCDVKGKGYIKNLHIHNYY